MIKGTIRADGIALLEVTTISFQNEGAYPSMLAKLAYIDSTTGATLGYVDHRRWSPSTIAAVAALRSAIEDDAAQLLLKAHTPPVPTAPEYLNPTDAPPA